MGEAEEEFARAEALLQSLESDTTQPPTPSTRIPDAPESTLPEVMSEFVDP